MRKSLWSPDEDEKLRHYVATHGCGNWSDVAKHTGLRRCGKSCRLRWINYLRPDLKRGPFSAQEVRLVVNLHNNLGNSWSKIATQLPGRTDNDVKNFWHSYTRSRRLQQQQKQEQEVSKNELEAAEREGKRKNNDKQNCRDGDEDEKRERGHDQEQLVSIPNNTTGNINIIKGLADCCKDPSKSVHNSPSQSHLIVCKPTPPPYPTSTLHTSLSHTNFLTIFHHPTSHTSHPLDSQLLFTQLDQTNTSNPLFHPDHDLKPIITHLQSHYPDHPAEVYKGPQSHIIIDPTCCSKGPALSFQHFPLSQEASDDHNNSMSTPFSSSYSDMSTLQMENAALDHGGRYAMSLPSKPLNSPRFVPGECPAGDFCAVRSLPASHEENDQGADTDIKPPEGLQSVIWSFINRQATADSAETAASVDDHHISQYHNHHHKPNSTPPLSLDYLPHQLSPDQYTIEALSTSAALQYLQAQLADCFS